MHFRECAQNETTQGHLPRRALGYLLGFFLKPTKYLTEKACVDSCVWAMALECYVFSANVLQGTQNPDLKGRTEVIGGSLASAVNYGEVYGMIYVLVQRFADHLQNNNTEHDD